MEGSVRARLGPAGQSAFDWVHWFLKMRAYDYMCMGFVLLKAGDTVHYWTSIYFIVHVLAVGCIAFGRLTRGGGQRGEKRGGKRGEKEEGKVEEVVESKDKLKEDIRAKQD